MAEERAAALKTLADEIRHSTAPPAQLPLLPTLCTRLNPSIPHPPAAGAADGGWGIGRIDAGEVEATGSFRNRPFTVDGEREKARLFFPVDAELELPRSVEDVVAVLEADYRCAYFLTGNFTLGIYAEDCLYEDQTIKFRGRSKYAQNLDLLVPFFDSPSLELENIEKGLRAETTFIMATWTLRTYLRLPWRPLIAIRGNTTYDLDEEYKVVRHSESWDVSALEAIAQLFVSAPKQTGS